MATQTPLTEAQFDALPSDDEKLYELLDGELVEMGRPGWQHQRISLNLIRSLDAYLRTTDSGALTFDIEFALGEGRRLVPDLAVLLNGKWEQVDKAASVVRVVPDLVVEIISPSELAYHVDRKIRTYLHAGVAEVLVVYPIEQHVQSFTTTGIRDFGGEGELTASLLPGWSLPLALLFHER